MIERSSDQSFSGIVIGVGAPNRTRDNRVVQCAIVLEDNIGLIRVYSDYGDRMEKMSLWDRVNLKARASPKDNRFESWKAVSVEVTGEKIKTPFEKRAILESCVISTAVDPIDELNRMKRSIALVKPKQRGIGYGMEIREEIDESPDWMTTQSETPQRPILKWESEQGGKHNQQICSHEVYEWIRKNPSSHGGLWDNLRITDIDYEKWLLIGTQNVHRSSWVVIHIHRLKKTPQIPIGFGLPIHDGKPEGWPYSRAGEVDAKRVESTGQLLLPIT